VSATHRVLGRIPYAGASGNDFDWLTDAGLRAAADNPDNVYGALLGLLAGCRPAVWPMASEGRGPTYAQLRAVADALGMTPEQVEEWMLLAESVALSERHVLHILGALAEDAA
jgi:hypothetical protein